MGLQMENMRYELIFLGGKARALSKKGSIEPGRLFFTLSQPFFVPTSLIQSLENVRKNRTY